MVLFQSGSFELKSPPMMRVQLFRWHMLEMISMSLEIDESLEALR